MTNCDETSLRAAMSGGGLVTFACDGTIVLTNTIVVAADTALDASGHAVTISGGKAVRVFIVNSGIRFGLANLRVIDGFAAGRGAGLENYGHATLVNCTFGGHLMIGAVGCGAAVSSAGPLTAIGCAFVNNRAVGTNGFSAFGGALGGGIPGTHAAWNLTNCTFYGNSASGGGGIFAACQSGNGPVHVVNCTFAANTNGAVFGCASSGGVVTLQNTIVAGGTGPNLSGVVDGGHNLSSDASGGFTNLFSLENIDPRLGPLADNGGPTPTVALLADSPAIDAANGSVSPSTDQRGVVRPDGAGWDIGAYEATEPGSNAGVFKVNVPNSLVNESATNVLVQVIRAGGVAGSPTVSFATSNGTATAGADFVATNGTLSFAPGERTKSFSVSVLNDSLVEAAEGFTIELFDPTDGAVLDRSSATVTILDDDVGLRFGTNSFSASEGAGAVTITVLRTGGTNTAVSVNYATAPGTARAGSDYTSASGTLNFAARQTSATFSIPIRDDNLSESNETVLLALSNPSAGATLLDPASATLTIIDNEPLLAVRFNTPTASVSEGVPEVSLSVVLSTPTDHEVSVGFATSDGTAVSGSDYVATSGTLTFPAGEAIKTLRVALLDDAISEGNETFAATLFNPNGGVALGSPAAMTVTMVDAVRTVGVCDESALRAALVSGGRIQFGCDGTLVLSESLLINVGTSLDAGGHDVTISGSNAVRLFNLTPGATLTLLGLKLVDGLALGTNGSGPGGPALGGAIYNNGGLLQAIDCAFLRHRAQGGAGGVLQTSVFPRPQPGGPGRGGVVYLVGGGQLVASNCVFAFNRALGGTAAPGEGESVPGGDASGGVIYSAGGAVRLSDCLVQSNRVVSGQGRRYSGPYASGSGSGGAICNDGGSLELGQVLVSRNICLAEYGSTVQGGAIWQRDGTMTLSDCWFAGNQALGGAGMMVHIGGLPGGAALGGAVCLASGNGHVSRSTFADNLALGGKSLANTARAGSGEGGAVHSAGNLEMVNCTLAGNAARGGVAGSEFIFRGSGRGGAIFNGGGAVSLTHVTVANNAAAHSTGGSDQSGGVSEGGGLWSSNGVVTLRNTILAYSASGSNWFGATLVDDGNNLSSDASCPFTALGSLSNTDPLLAPLDDFGGPTPTMALLAGSPALNTANPAWCPPTDQRSVARPYGSACDIGAFESAPPYSIRGGIAGYLASLGGNHVTSGNQSAPVDPVTGRYVLWNFDAGNHLATARASQAVFEPNDRLVSVSADVVGVNFQAWRSNALTIDTVSGPVYRNVFAGAASDTWDLMLSTNLPHWQLHSTHTVEPNGLFDFRVTNAAGLPPTFFKAEKP